MTSRDISDWMWEHMRAALVFYFMQRGVANPEDWAQETLKELVRRDDYLFEKEEDFPLIAYGFARRVLRSGWRQEQKHAAAEFDERSMGPAHSAIRLQPSEMAVLLREVVEAGRATLSPADWQSLEEAAEGGCADPADADDATGRRRRVRLFRARQKLARLSGWKRRL